MSTTLNLVDRLLAKGRTYHLLGREQDALVILRRLSRFADLPGEAAEEAQARLAEIHLHRRQYRRTRRHLTAALRHRPDCAHYHYLMACALEADEKGDPERAADHYRRALQLDPDHHEGLGAYGLLAVRLGQIDQGLACLRRLTELAPANPEAVQQLVVGLQLAGRPDEARAALIAARFRNPRDRRFRKLWDDFQFHQLRKEQQASPTGAAAEAVLDGPVLLPFRRPVSPEAHPEGKVVRLDAASPPSPPHTPGPAPVPRRRHA